MKDSYDESFQFNVMLIDCPGIIVYVYIIDSPNIINKS